MFVSNELFGVKNSFWGFILVESVYEFPAGRGEILSIFLGPFETVLIKGFWHKGYQMKAKDLEL